MKKWLLEEDLLIGRRTLLVVLDETGQEDFKATPGKVGKPVVFGLAGVIGLGPSFVLAEKRWRAMKKTWWGGEDAPLHGSGAMLSREQLDAVSDFFRRSRLGRFAYLMKRPPLIVPGTNALNLMRTPLLRELMKFICSPPVLPDDIVLMFEHSERLAPKQVELLPGFTIEVDGKSITSRGCSPRKARRIPSSRCATRCATARNGSMALTAATI
ncbi:MAG: hypothetical protein WDO17_06245 [Alphaproteobacteria bacterium]